MDAATGGVNGSSSRWCRVSSPRTLGRRRDILGQQDATYPCWLWPPLLGGVKAGSEGHAPRYPQRWRFYAGIAIFHAVALAASAFGASPATSRGQEHFKRDAYTVTWTEAQTTDSPRNWTSGTGQATGSPLIGCVSDHASACGGRLVKLRVGGSPWQSKWPPDRATVAVTHAQMKPDAYVALLRELAVVDAAELRAVQQTP